VERVNAVNTAPTPIAMPDIRFNRHIGEYSGQYWSTDGRRLSPEEWEAYASTALPGPEDEARLNEYFKNSAWIAPKGKSAA